MATSKTVLVLVALLVAGNTDGAAQGRPAELDAVRAQIHTTLRRFYFNLAHQDWEALTSDILAAKVVAHRPAPEALAMGAGGRSLASDQVTECPTEAAALVDRAIITLDGAWAEVSVPSCAATPSDLDEFRLINFEDRWRIVYIDLFQEPVSLSADR